MRLNSIDVFSGVGGQSAGLKKAGFVVNVSIEIDKHAIAGYKLNHPDAIVIDKDIRKLKSSEIKKILNGEPLHLLAGCPPCQGFSSVRRLNKKKSAPDDRNSLILEYLRLVRELKPLTIMMENVPGLVDYYQFKKAVKELTALGYNPKFEVVNVKDYGVPQSRRRLILVGSLLGDIDIAKVKLPKATVRKAIGKLTKINKTKDEVHKIIPKHIPRIQKMISLVPKNGGSRKDLPEEYTLECHKKKNVGFNDIYGRLRWDDYSSTITGGCLNPSKGRFLHPEENRCISAREAALLQTFPASYKFPLDVPKTKLALMIGNALPPKFSYHLSKNIRQHLEKHL